MAHSSHRKDSITRIDPSDVRSTGAVTIDPTDQSIRVSWSKLSPPTNVYDADFAWAVERHGTVSLFFAKEHISGKSLRSRLEIRFSPEPFVEVFWANTVTFYEALKAREATAVPPAPATRAPQELMALQSDREHSDWANFAYIAHHGTQASLDFFRLPPAGIARFITTGQRSADLEPSPIVRIHTTIWELSRFLDVCEPIASRLRASLPTEKKA